VPRAPRREHGRDGRGTSSLAAAPRCIHFHPRCSEIRDGPEFFFPPVESRHLFYLTSSSPVRYNSEVMPLYATRPHFQAAFSPPHAHDPRARPSARTGYPPGPLSSSVSWRPCVHATPKTDILNEATILLKTKGRKAQFSLWRSRYITENRAVTKNESDTKSW